MEKLIKIFKPVGELSTNKLLKDKDLLVRPVEILAGESYVFKEGNVNFSIEAQSSLTVELLNDETEKDQKEENHPNDSSPNPSSLISFDPETTAYLKYETAIFPQAKGGFSLNDLGFDFELSAGIKAVFLKGHKNTESIQKAFSSDMSNFLTIFKWEDVLKLEVGDALCLNAEGTLNSSLQISWSNILAQSLRSISSNLPKPVTLDINLTPKLTASFSVTISDQFSYFIKRIDENRLSVSLRKAKNSLAKGGVGAKVGIAFSKPEEVEKNLEMIVDQVVNSLLKKERTSIDNAIEALNKETASFEQNELVLEVAEFLGISNPLENINPLQNRLKKLQEDFKTKLSRIAKANAELSFSFEYKRIKEGSEILALDLSDTSLKPYHRELLGFNLTNLVNDLGNGKVSDAKLISYINQTTVRIEKSWGFGLSLMGEQLIKGSDFKIEKDIIRLDLHKHSQISIQRARGYDWKLGKKEEGKWLTEINATMKSFSMSKDPTFSELDLNIYLNLVVSDGRLKNRGEFKKLLDLGVLWGSILQEEVEMIVDKYFPVLENKAVTIESKLIFPESITKILVKKIGIHGLNDVNKRLMAKSMAASMPYINDFELRNSVLERENTYWPLWLDFLNKPEQSKSDLPKKAFEHLRKISNSGSLPEFEKQAGSNNQGLYFADVIYTNPKIFDDLEFFLEGIRGLATCINSNSIVADNFQENYLKISQFLTQSFYVRSLGSFLGRYASEDPLFSNEVQRIFTITYQEEGETWVINMAVIK